MAHVERVGGSVTWECDSLNWFLVLETRATPYPLYERPISPTLFYNCGEVHVSKQSDHEMHDVKRCVGMSQCSNLFVLLAYI